MLGPADIRDWLDDAPEETKDAAAPRSSPAAQDRATTATTRFPTLPSMMFGMMAWPTHRRGPRS